MKSNLFRQAALDQLSSPDRLDEMMAIARPRDWLLLLSIAMMMGVAVMWAYQGRITTKTEGQGVLVLAGGVVNVVSEGSGRVLEVRVKTGDLVALNQVVGSLSQPALQEKIKAARQSLAELERERARAGGSRTEGLRLQTGVLNDQKTNLRRDIGDADEQVKTLDEQVRVEEELLAKGLITRQQVLATRQKRTAAGNTIANLEAQIKQLDSTQYQNQSQAVMADRDYEARIAEAQRSIQLMETDLRATSVVRSAYAGKVIELKVYSGALVATGDPFISIEPSAERLEVIAYVPAARAKEIHPGMDVEVVPSSVKREEYGFLKGKAVRVAEFPATRTAVMRIFENESLVAALAAGGPVNEVRIALETDANGGFRWSTPQAPPFPITSGTLCAASIVTRAQRPIELVVPFLKQKLGI